MRGFIEYKNLLSKSILVTRQREWWGKKVCSVTQVYPERHLTAVENILSWIADVQDLLASQNSKIFFPRNKLRNFQHYFEIEFFSSPKKMKNCIPSDLLVDIWLQKLSSCYVPFFFFFFFFFLLSISMLSLRSVP